MKRKLRGSIVVEASIVVPLVLVLSLAMIILIIKEYQTTVNTLKSECAMFLPAENVGAMAAAGEEQEFFRCEDGYVYKVSSEYSYTEGRRWKQTSDYFKVFDINLEDEIAVTLDPMKLTTWLKDWERMRAIRRR